MQNLAQRRCLNHVLREAVARCPECDLFFCRECIIDHDDRVVCASCVKKLVQTPFSRRYRFIGFVRTTQLFFGVVTVWLFFYLLGQALLSLPTSFHDGSVW